MAWLSESAMRGTRLTTLRRLEGLTQAELADTIGVSQAFISQVEKEAKALPPDVAHRVADKFDLPRSFFTFPPDASEHGVATFRKSSKASVRDDQHVTALFDEAARLFRIASQASRYRSAELADFAHEDEEVTAGNIRAHLGLDSSEPIANATRALERLGVGVIHALDSVDSTRRDHDGISRPTPLNDRPLVATVGDQPPAVARMTVLHELAHLIYDKSLTTPIRSRRAPEERRAYRLAGSLLIPAYVVRRRITESLTLHGYLRVKADYGISVSALIHRASDLGVISATRKRSLYIQWSSQGWRASEPVTVAKEEPLLLSQAVTRGISHSLDSVADRTGVRVADLRRWLPDLDEGETPDNVIPLGRRSSQEGLARRPDGRGVG